jgi:hypothetical protein
MSPSRPYKCLRDIVDNEGKLFSSQITINLFDIDNWSECVNELEYIDDDIKRTIAYLPEGRAFILRISYKDFDSMMIQMKADYNMLDDRSINPPDKIKYKGYIQTSAAIKPQFMVVTFHRKGYELKGRSEKDFQEFAHNALFNYIYPMN